MPERTGESRVQTRDGRPSGLARYLSRPEAQFDIQGELEKIKQSATWRETGHNAKELVKYPDLRIALIALKAWKRIEGHRADARISVQTVSGRIKLHLPDDTVELPVGRFLTLERGIKHDVEAEEESAFLLTICWPAATPRQARGEAVRTLDYATVEAPAKLVDYQPGSVVSRQLLKNGAGNVTVFAFDEGQGLSEHTAPFDALAHVLEGTGEIAVAGRAQLLSAGEAILMPADQPHAIKAVKRFKMMLTMLRG